MMMMMRWIGSHGLPLRRLCSFPIQYSKPCTGATVFCSLAESWTSPSPPQLGCAEMLVKNHLEENIIDKVNRFVQGQPIEVGNIVADLNQLKALRQSMHQQIPSLPDPGISREPSLLTGLNKGGLVAPTCRIEKADTREQVAVYIRLHTPLVPNMTRNDMRCSWFAIPAQQGVNADDANDFLSPIFQEPLLKGCFEYIPVVVGSRLFIIGGMELSPSEKCAPTTKNPCGMMFRRVHYLDTQSGEKKWEDAPTLEKAPLACYVFALDGKIYVLGDYCGNSFSLKYLDCHNLNEGWKSLLCSSDESQHRFFRVVAHTIEYEVVNDPSVGQPKSRARRAIMVANVGLISYDFVTNEIDFWEGSICHCPYFSTHGVCHNGALYLLAGDYYDTGVQMMVYDLETREWSPTPVIGFEKHKNALPKIDSYEYSVGDICPVLLRLGKERFGLVWFDSDLSICCTKFNIKVTQGQHRAEEVSTHAYQIGDYTNSCFMAVTI